MHNLNWNPFFFVKKFPADYRQTWISLWISPFAPLKHNIESHCLTKLLISIRLATLHYLQYVSQTGATWRHLSNQSSSLVPIALFTDGRSASQWGNKKFGNWSKRTLNTSTSVICLKVDCGRLQDRSQSKIVRSPASIAQPVFKHRGTKAQHWWKTLRQTTYITENVSCKQCVSFHPAHRGAAYLPSTERWPREEPFLAVFSPQPGGGG